LNDIDGEVINLKTETHTNTHTHTHAHTITRICKECSGGMFRSFQMSPFQQ